jgi:molybdenum cofactor biosynthesis protein B
MGTEEHKSAAPQKVTIAIITLSSSRTLQDDQSGQWIREAAHREGHDIIDHRVVRDDSVIIAATLRKVIDDLGPQVVLMDGGTGITAEDVTIETVKPLFSKELTAFGAAFAFLSMKEIGSAVILSRATAGVIGSTVVFCMPGSLNACRLACRELIFPELGHLVKHVRD